MSIEKDLKKAKEDLAEAKGHVVRVEKCVERIQEQLGKKAVTIA